MHRTGSISLFLKTYKMTELGLCGKVLVELGFNDGLSEQSWESCSPWETRMGSVWAGWHLWEDTWSRGEAEMKHHGLTAAPIPCSPVLGEEVEKDRWGWKIFSGGF